MIHNDISLLFIGGVACTPACVMHLIIFIP